MEDSRKPESVGEAFDFFQLDSQTASLESVKKQYKLLALKFHPDKNQGLTTSKFKQLQAAFSVLNKHFENLENKMIKVAFKFDDGQTLQAKVRQKSTLQSLSVKSIFKRHLTDSTAHLCYFRSFEIHPESSLVDLGIQDSSIISVVLIPSLIDNQRFIVIHEKEFYTTFGLTVGANQTIGYLRKIISIKQAIDLQDIRLVFGTVHLQLDS